MNEKRNRYITGSLVALAIVLVGGYVLWQGSQRRAATTPTSQGTTTLQASPGTVVVTSPDGNSYTISQQPITAPGSQSSDFVNKNDAAIKSLQAGNYQSALTAWLALSAEYPSDASVYANLGNLYMSYLQDYSKAEANYLLAIKYKPDNADPYRELFTLYTTTNYHPTADAAVNILKQGIAANPNAVDLQVQLARYYKAQGDTTDAQAEYQAAIANAQRQGQTSLATQLQAEASQ